MTRDKVIVNQTIVRDEGFLISDMDGEKVMLSINSGKYYNLGQVGGRIWDLAASPIPVSKIIDTLVSEYDIERSKCEQQVMSFLDQLWREEIIQVQQEAVTL